MRRIFVVISTDLPSIGRTNLSIFSQQVLMVADFNEKVPLLDSEVIFKDISRWPRLDLTEARDVRKMEWSSGCPTFLRHGGTIDFQYIPPTMESMGVHGLNLSGTLETTLLPDSLVKFSFPYNLFCGTVDFTRLPQAMEELDVFANSFTGTVNLTQLPAGLVALNAGSNKFHGSLLFENLPASVKQILIETNDFSGRVIIVRPPQSLRRISVVGDSIYEVVDGRGDIPDNERVRLQMEET